jgi:hypothetical protein
MEFNFPFPLPEEVQKALEEAHDKAHMHNEAFGHTVVSFMNDLTPDYLRILRGLFANIRNDDEGGSRATLYYEGWITGILQYKFNICPICGKNHDEEIQNLTEPSVQDQDAYAHKTVSWDAEKPAEPQPHRFSSNANEVDLERDRLMDQYHLEGVTNDADEVILYRCERCHMEYPSIEARIQTAPEECVGCFQKAAWG